jgi:hypothetical protein
MRIMILAALVVVAGWGALGGVESDKPDFSGIWVFDPVASRIDPLPGRIARTPDSDITLTITREGPIMHCERRAGRAQNLRNQRFELFTDGRESTIPDRQGNEIKARFDWQGEQLCGDFSISAQNPGGRSVAITVRQVFYLADGGRKLMIETHRQFPRRQQSEILVFNKSG